MARTGTGGGSSSTFIVAMENGTFFVTNETPTGAVNGVNTVYTLASDPNPDSSFELEVNGLEQILTDDYILSGSTVTTTIAWPTGTKLRCNYRVEPAP